MAAKVDWCVLPPLAVFTIMTSTVRALRDKDTRLHSHPGLQPCWRLVENSV